MPAPVLSMTQRLENTSAILGEYMLKGWTLTDLHCDHCRVTPLMREPAAIARREHRPPSHFCAQCDGGPVRRPTRQSSASSASSFMTANSSAPTSPTTAHAPALPSTPRRRLTPPETPTASHFSNSPTSPPSSHVASVRGDPDSAADAISSLMLRGYSLLSSTCPDPACKDVPLVGFPRRSNGARDPRRECVSCGKRWVDEKDLAASGLRLMETSSMSSSASTSRAPPSPRGIATPTRRRHEQQAGGSDFSEAGPSGSQAESRDTQSRRTAHTQEETPTTGLERNQEPESPHSRARRELYEQGTAVMAERARNQAAKQAEDDALATAATASRATTSTGAGSSAAMNSTFQPTNPAFQSASRSLQSTNSTSRSPGLTLQSVQTATSRKPFVSDEHRPAVSDGKLRVVIVSSGSVASVKIPNIVAHLGTDPNIEVQVVSTDASLYFFNRDDVERDNKGVNVWRDVDEWSDWKKIGDPILHIELRRWADMVVVAPCSADMLAKIAGGICDNMPLSMLRALSADTPVILCPAMNTHMFAHPLTARHTAFVKEVLGYHVLGPQGAGMLACGDVGAGKMTEWTDIVRVIRGYAHKTQGQPETSRRSILTSIMAPLEADQELSKEIDVFYSPKEQASVQLQNGPPRDNTSIVIKVLAPLVMIYSAVCNAVLLPLLRLFSAVPRILLDIVCMPATAIAYILSPLLLLLHAMFTISSVVLRVVQAQPKPLGPFTKDAPEHLALILVPGELPPKVRAERYVESVRRAVIWAAEWGVKTLTVWDEHGLGSRQHQLVTDSLLDLPPSPPSSGASSPRASSESNDVTVVGDETVSASVYVNTDHGPRRVEVHFLAPSASDSLARVARRFARDGVDPELVDQDTLDAAVKRDLRIPTDPDLVIIHHLAPPGFVRGLLPRPAPELHGFPAWLLRISEIYAHPPRLPLYVPFLGALLQNSPLPILRKVGGAFPSTEDEGVLSPAAWEGAQGAWEKVEQRKGK